MAGDFIVTAYVRCQDCNEFFELGITECPRDFVCSFCSGNLKFVKVFIENPRKLSNEIVNDNSRDDMGGTEYWKMHADGHLSAVDDIFIGSKEQLYKEKRNSDDIHYTRKTISRGETYTEKRASEYMNGYASHKRRLKILEKQEKMENIRIKSINLDLEILKLITPF